MVASLTSVGREVQRTEKEGAKVIALAYLTLANGLESLLTQVTAIQFFSAALYSAPFVEGIRPP